MIWILLACTGDPADTGEVIDSGAGEITSYVVNWWTDPEPMIAQEGAEFYTQITDQGGNSIEDLQTNHERIVHNIFVSADLESFTHTHMEDFYTLTVDDLRNSTFHFPLTLPLSGSYLGIFDYAHENQWLKSTDLIDVGGDVPQLSAVNQDFSTSRASGDLEVSITWDVAPIAGYESAFTVHVQTATGEDVTDLIQYLGADAHMAVVAEDLSFASHTHAWFPGMEDMSPTMDMPHLNPGPDLPFHFTFGAAGTYKMWVQFVRESDPENVHAVPFMFVVSG